jgi:hypothetical protein
MEYRSCNKLLSPKCATKDMFVSRPHTEANILRGELLERLCTLGRSIFMNGHLEFFLGIILDGFSVAWAL